MQVKRGIDRLIETLYSWAVSEDIDIEFKTAKHNRDKLESMRKSHRKTKEKNNGRSVKWYVCSATKGANER
ncbi:hypothetical protein [Wolbachia endosymbiont of Wuchereria bancrofti]|uniref:hypothetical protein n=1 Tax=Wolbachia endosymbiont of Wuchereria bancrofti TaxID=96496 RepID=UPI001FE393A0|nr:hypothetical protein [Wolbachia endosymbiont of Wuchereria bancrofti]